MLIVGAHAGGVMLMAKGRTVRIRGRHACLHRMLMVSLTRMIHTSGSLMHLSSGPSMTGGVSTFVIAAGLDAARRSTRSSAATATPAARPDLLVTVGRGLILSRC